LSYTVLIVSSLYNLSTRSRGTTAEDLQGATPGFAFTEIVSRQCRSVILGYSLTLLLRAVAVLATASIQVHRLSRRHMRAASGSLLTAGEWISIVLPPTRHSLTPLRATIAHDALAASLTDSPPDIVGRSTALSRGSRQTR